jgi:metal-dependent HD superfamily phosphatase/phosphodiesterase
MVEKVSNNDHAMVKVKIVSNKGVKLLQIILELVGT